MSSIRSSKFYNNPQIGAAFDNIASMFAPPSAQETYAYAKARAEREDAARKQQVYDYANDPNYDSSVADRKAAAAGVYLPTQSWYAVDQGNATTRRGQDLESGDRRYATDQGVISKMYTDDRAYASSTENNARDNATKIKDREMQEAGALQRFYASPVVAKQGERVFLPGQTAAATGLAGQLDGPEMSLTESQQLAQIIANMPTERQTQIVDNKFAPTETQVQGRALQQRFDNNDITPQMQVEKYQGQETPVEVIGPDGKPVYMSPGAAVALGAQPYKAPTAASKPELQNWIGPNGSGGGTAVYDAVSGQWQDTTTRQPLPAGSRTYTGQLQGGADATGLGPTTSNATEATRLESSLDQAQTLVGGIRSILSQNKNVAGVPGRLKGVVQSLTSSAQQVASVYAAEAPEAALSIDEARNLIEKKLGASMRGYDPDIVRVQSMLYDLAYARAQMANPSGEVSRQGFERALESLGQGVLSSQTDLETALDAFERDTIGAGRVKVDTLRGRRPGAAPSAASSPVAATAAPGGAARLRFDANGDPIQ